MNKTRVALAEEIEAALVIGDELAARTLAEVERLTHRQLTGQDLESTDLILGLIHAQLPGWSVSIRGTATLPNGHWRCSLRRSSARDNDEFIGIARGPTLPHALLAAMLKAASFEPA